MPKFVTIIIPCRNEEKHISTCLEAILQQDYPKDFLEILVADGMSTDKTRQILQSYSQKHDCIRWFENPGKIVPTGLNTLIQNAKGEVIVRMDAHNDYPRDYVSKCVHYLFKENVDNVGGVWSTMPASQTPVAKAIALAISSTFGVGNALFRTGVLKEPRMVDTVPFGCYRRDVFDRIGLFDEDLIRNQDDEFNSRLIKNGGKILLVPEIVSKYYTRPTFAKLWRMYFQYGYFKPLTVLKLGGIMTTRQLIPSLYIISLFVCALAGLFVHPMFHHSLLFWQCSLYLMANLLVSIRVSMGQNILLFPFLMVAYFTVHFGYGFGYLKGVWDFIIVKRHLKNKIRDMAISR